MERMKSLFHSQTTRLGLNSYVADSGELRFQPEWINEYSSVVEGFASHVSIVQQLQPLDFFEYLLTTEEPLYLVLEWVDWSLCEI